MVAAPKGPIGLTCIRCTLTSGWTRGITAGLGAATGHALLAVMACLGAAWLENHKGLIQIGGGLFLLYLGWRIWNRPAVEIEFASRSGTGALGWQRDSFAKAYWTTLGLQVATPVNSFLAQTAYLNSLGGSANLGSAMPELTVGVFGGSLLWWLLLVSAVSTFRSIVNPSCLLWINRVAACAFIIFGVNLLVTYVTDLARA
jgi:putative LysE/RhtB family amino acid efflux pump